MTERQEQVLALFAEGHNAESVAHQLGITTRTANFHKDKLFRMAGASNTVEMLQFFYEFVRRERKP